jgi:Na+-transporting methylmalonyl-CoA/oxaloacetate decarboxylase gamma subunit
MNTVLRISILGASMVIFGLILLWFLMDLLVRATNIRKKRNVEMDDESYNEENTIELEHKQKSAAAAIAVAMALLNTSFISSSPSHANDGKLSAWQMSHRNQQMSNRLNTTYRDREKK